MTSEYEWLISGSVDCTKNKQVDSFAKSSNVVSIWVDCVARGRGEEDVTIPRNFKVKRVMIVIDGRALGSTQLGVHFAILKAIFDYVSNWYVVLIDGLTEDRVLGELAFLDDYQLVTCDELASLVD